MTHGDDFVVRWPIVTGPTHRLADLKNQISGCTQAKQKSSATDQRKASRHGTGYCTRVQRGVADQHDPTDVDALVKDLGLEHGKSVQTPAVHDVTDDEPEPLDQTQSSNHRSQVARCLFFSQDRADNIRCERVVSKHVKHHTAEHCNIEEVGQILERSLTYSGSDWACCKATRESRSAGMILLGNHTLNAYTARRQSCPQQRLRASESKGMVSLLCNLGYEIKTVVTNGAKATEHTLHRHGIDRLRKTRQTSAPKHSAKQ